MSRTMKCLLGFPVVFALGTAFGVEAKTPPPTVSAQGARPESSGESARPVLENDRVVAWEATQTSGQPAEVETLDRDRVSVDLADASIRISTADGVSRSVSLTPGQVLFDPKGTAHSVVVTSDSPRHVILVDLKDVAVPAAENGTGFPNAYPRDDARKLLENDRVVVWEYTWTTGVPSPTHFHDKDAVIVFMGTGELTSTTPDGSVRSGSRSFGDVVFSPANTTHVEELTTGSARSIVIELK